MKALSGGERNRLLLARLFTRPANVLVLDEPTNDLDLETLELLEAQLVEWPGTLLLVSHDRALPRQRRHEHARVRRRRPRAGVRRRLRRLAAPARRTAGGGTRPARRRDGRVTRSCNVTLGGNSTKILAANSITIFNNVVVTIGGSKPADVYTGFTNEVPNANYTGFGGNGSTTGTFGGAGANDPQPIEKAPPFDSTNHVTSSGKPRGGGKATDTTINVSNSDELLALLNDVHPGRNGRIRVPDSKRASDGTNPSRFNAAADVNAHRRAMDRADYSIPGVMRRLPQ